MKKINILRIFSALLTFIIIIIIFLFSSENADNSSDTSGYLVKIIISFFHENFESMAKYQQKEIFDEISHIIRKTAHFSIYTALGFCLSLAVGKRKIISLKSFLVIVFCFLYACSDEIHQYFVAGRSCMFTDVIIDTCGSITGLAISAIILTIISKKSKGRT
ncbi:MAG: VanZ family protein [Ruminococcus sp.]|nr:VanZ family protein [Ruminococcus sp.]